MSLPSPFAGAGRHVLVLGLLGSLAADARSAPLGGASVSDFAPTKIVEASPLRAAASSLPLAIEVASTSPGILTEPSSQDAEHGRHAHLAVTATGETLSYQWFRGVSGDTTQPVVGATSAHLLTLPVVAPQSFWVRVTNPAGFIDSVTATITPRARPEAMLSGAGALGYGALGESIAAQRISVPRALAADTADLAHSHSHALVIRSDGSLWAQGRNTNGQLGLGDTVNRSTPTQVSSGVITASVGSFHSLFLKNDGTLWATGLNSSGQLGTGDTTDRVSPVQIASDVQALATGGSHSLWLKNDGTLWGTGINSSGQLGIGSTTDASSPVQIANGVSALAAGSSHSLFLKTDGSLWSMGRNNAGQLGDGSTTNRTTPVRVADQVIALSTHASGDHSLFLTEDGSLFGMGDNSSGQLDAGDNPHLSTPVLIDTAVTACAAGLAHSLWIKNDRSLWGVGANAFDQLGLGNAADQRSPREIAADVTTVAATAYASWFVVGDGKRYGMGRNDFGQFGRESAAFTAPVPLAADVSAIAVNYGSGPETRRLDLTGKIWSSLGAPADRLAWPGDAGAGAVRMIPMPIFKAVSQSIEFAAGRDRLLFLRADGSLWGAGDNSSGALGTGDTLPRTEPVQIATDVADAVATGYGTTFLKTDGSLWTVGEARSGLGGGGQHVFGLSPLRLDSDVVAIAASYFHVLYLKADASLWGFGDGGYRQLNTASSTGSSTGAVFSTPVLIATDVARFAAGQRHTLLVKTDGTLWACGMPGFGQLGVSGGNVPWLGLTQVTSPTAVASGVADVVTTAETSFIIKTDGTVWATGTNTEGQLGGGTLASYSSFFRIGTDGRQSLTGVAKIVPALSGENTFFLRTDGSLWGTGRNDHGQLGLGHTNAVIRPTLLRAQAYDVAASGLHTLILHDPVDLAPPAILTQPASQNVAFGDFAALSVSASGDALLSYQWYRGASGDTSQPVPQATDSTLRLPAFAGTATYWARVSNVGGSADSASATITVVGAGSPAFRAWAEAAGLAGSRLAISADADGDGLANLLEYAFGRSPANGSDRAAPQPELIRTAEGDFLVLTHRRLKGAALDFSYEASADLQEWQPRTLTPILLDPDADGDGLVEEVSVALPLSHSSDAAPQFLRVRVSEP